MTVIWSTLSNSLNAFAITILVNHVARDPLVKFEPVCTGAVKLIVEQTSHEDIVEQHSESAGEENGEGNRSRGRRSRRVSQRHRERRAQYHDLSPGRVD